MKVTMWAVTIVAMLGIAGTAQAAGDAAAGKAKAGACAGCHGANGEGTAPNPPLAGMAEAGFIQAMKDYKTGKRNHAMMKMFAGQLGDADVANLAAYYGSLKKK